jgi:hypothetical protein
MTKQQQMGTKLAELAKANRLKGVVCITDAKGVTHNYPDEAAAYEAWKDRIGSLEHRRGAFFVKEMVPATPTAPAAPPLAAPKPKRSEK